MKRPRDIKAKVRDQRLGSQKQKRLDLKSKPRSPRLQDQDLN